MHPNPVYISKEGLEKMRVELHELKTVRRREVSERIEKAKELGDLRENADYHEAKEEKAQIEERIIQLEDGINRAKVIESAGGDTVTIGSIVTVFLDQKEKEFRIVGSREAEPLKGLISNESPLGVRLIGKKVGDIVEVPAPSGTIRYAIKAIK